MTNMAWIVIGAAVVALMVFGMIGSVSSDMARTEQMKACMAAGGSWSIEWGIPKCTRLTPPPETQEADR